ncbi:MAG: hypothetical protein ACE5QF_02720 [Thermoplasmata archaeon]
MAPWKLQAAVFWAAFLAVSFVALGVGLTSSSGLLAEDESYYFYGSALMTQAIALLVMLIYGSVWMGRIESLLRKDETGEFPGDLEELASGMWKRMLSPALQLVFLITISSAAIPSSGWFLTTHHEINTTAAIEVLLGSVVSILFALIVLLSIRNQIRRTDYDYRVRFE